MQVHVGLLAPRLSPESITYYLVGVLSVHMYMCVLISCWYHLYNYQSFSFTAHYFPVSHCYKNEGRVNTGLVFIKPGNYKGKKKDCNRHFCCVYPKVNLTQKVFQNQEKKNPIIC